MRSGHRGAADRVRRGVVCTVAVAATLVVAASAASSALGQSEARAYYGPDGKPLPFQSDSAVIAFLRDATVVDSRPAPGGTSGALWLTLEDTRGRARAAFRHVSEQRRNIQLRDGGAFAGFYDSAMSEVAAYAIALELGIRMIPPVTERRHDGKDGTIQLWIEDAMTEGTRSREGHRPPDLRRWRLQRTTMAVFDALLHNTDRNSGNSLIDPRWNLWMIDHTRTFQRPRGRIEFAEVSQVPESLWATLRRLDMEQVQEMLRPYIEPLQVVALFERRDALVRHLEQLIAERGYEAVVLGDEAS